MRGFLSFDRAPITWSLVGVNVLFFFLTMGRPPAVELLNEHDIELAGRIYTEQMQMKAPESSREWILRGAMALRDENFYANVRQPASYGNTIGFEKFKDKIFEFQRELTRRPLDAFGIHAKAGRPLSWITYQFMHSGAMHLLSNMVLVLLFGAAIESAMGGGILVFVYLIGGIAGAWFFLAVSPPTTAPMVGASASLSAMMAFYALAERKKRIKFFYFIAPQEGYWGEIYLPTLLILPFYFVEDAASFFSTSEHIGAGVAHAAHLGGALLGLVVAGLIRWGDVGFARFRQIGR